MILCHSDTPLRKFPGDLCWLHLRLCNKSLWDQELGLKPFRIQVRCLLETLSMFGTTPTISTPKGRSDCLRYRSWHDTAARPTPLVRLAHFL